MNTKKTTLMLGFLLGVSVSGLAFADPVAHARTESNVDWVSAGISGVGGGSGTINVTGVTGSVSKAYLYWHGINTGGSYDNADITIDGNLISGTSIGTASTNCWGNGNSVAYRADVTSFVTADGDYDLAGLSALANSNANGASLVVTFDDGNSSNNRDLVFFEGNDSSVLDSGYPEDPDGWDAILSPINYGGGAVGMEFHVGDGQSFSDVSVNLSTPNGNLAIADTNVLWDGNSLPSAGTSRTTNGDLYDIHYFDITSAFGAVTGDVALTLDGQSGSADCHSLVLALVDLEPGTAPPPPGEPPIQPPIEMVPVPTLSTNALLILSGLMLLFGLGLGRRHF